MPALSVTLGTSIDSLFSLTDESRFARIDNMLWDKRFLTQQEFDEEEHFLQEKRREEETRPRATLLLAELYCKRAREYPDIHSLLLLSALFDVSLDQLIKGDLETMKQEVNAADVKAMNRDAIIFSILLAATIILPVPLIKWFGLYGLIPELLLWGSAMYFALRLERIKKANNVQSYREILAFSEGKRLDEIEQKVEAGKRPYQKVLLALLTAGITLLVGMVLSWLLL